MYSGDLNVIRQLAKEMERKLTSIVIGTIWDKKDHHARGLLTSINIGLTTMGLTPKERYGLVSYIFGRSMTSTKDLTIGEAQALKMAMLGEEYRIHSEFESIVNNWRNK